MAENGAVYILGSHRQTGGGRENEIVKFRYSQDERTTIEMLKKKVFEFRLLDSSFQRIMSPPKAVALLHSRLEIKV